MINILIVDDHPLMVEAYKSILQSVYSDENLVVKVAYNAKSAYNQLVGNASFDIVFLDFALPPYEAEKIFSGEDLAHLLRKRLPDTKIMMLTSHVEAFTIYQISKKIVPEGLLVKSDFNPEELLRAFKIVSDGGIYYSHSAKAAITEVGKNQSALDSYDRRIISLLAKGIKTKNLPDHLNITLSAIDKRKAAIKEFFEIDKGNDEDIIREAKKRGLI